ncbi:hypothetical protein L3X38_029144 [Prunus dulcis]|uniref:Uncharacterized protein n=1 Tax=Prunus dulcis TaxID=3755 RepID=A0AAD4VTV0_PRUDU|nr:hypothetical protein L3X38_029144 [Prunus dulcis]
MASSNAIEGEMEEAENSQENEEGETSASSSSLPLPLCYRDLPDYLQNCLMYCCILPDSISKGKLIRLLVAQGLMQEKAGHVMEDVAEENI